MAPRDARKAGESWGLSMARAEWTESPYDTIETYMRRVEAEYHAQPDAACAVAYWDGYCAGHRAEWARLEEEAEA